MYCVSVHTCRLKISINVIDSTIQTKLEQNTWNIASPHLHTTYLLNCETITRSVCFRSQLYYRKRDVNFAGNAPCCSHGIRDPDQKLEFPIYEFDIFIFPFFAFVFVKLKEQHERNFFFKLNIWYVNICYVNKQKLGYDIMWNFLRKIRLIFEVLIDMNTFTYHMFTCRNW